MASVQVKILIKGIESIVHSDKATGKEMYRLERVKKDVFDYINLLFDVTKTAQQELSSKKQSLQR